MDFAFDIQTPESSFHCHVVARGCFFAWKPGKNPSTSRWLSRCSLLTRYSFNLARAQVSFAGIFMNVETKE